MCFVQVKIRDVFLIITFLLHTDAKPPRRDNDICEKDDIWPKANQNTCPKSQPMCINSKMGAVTRCCNDDGVWSEKPECFLLQDTIKNPCPSRLNWLDSYCIWAIKDTTYPPNCPYEETAAFSEYVSAVSADLFPIWVPAVREIGRYGIGLPQWIEPTSRYKEEFLICSDDDDCTNFFSYSNDKNCVIAYSASNFEAVSCDEKHTAICAFKILPERDRSFCSQTFPSPNICIQSDYSTNSKCFCVGSKDTNSNSRKVEFLEPYQNLLNSKLSSSNDICYIGLRRTAGDDFIWYYSQNLVTYTNWSEDTCFDQEYIYGAVSSDGWTLTKTEDESSCILYETEIPSKESKLTIAYNEIETQFTVNITNPNTWLLDDNSLLPMVYCFTDAISNTIVSRIIPEANDQISSDYVTFSFAPLVDGPGTYWCEAFPYPTLKVQRSDEYLLTFTNSFTDEYVVIMKSNFIEDSDSFHQTDIKSFQDDFSKQMEEFTTTSFYPRIYKIIDINEDNSEITINFHLSDKNENEPLKQYNTLRSLMEHDITGFTFVNIFNVDRCIGIQTPLNASQTVTWPVTKIGEVAYKPREGYCVRKDGTIMNRHCYGNFIDGAQWSDLEENCIIQTTVTITMNLSNIVNLNNPVEYMDEVVEITTDYLNLASIDIYLISQFFEQIVQCDNIDVDSTVSIINNIMKVPGDILKESQILYNATNRLLYYIDQIVEVSEYMGEKVGEDFVLLSFYIKENNLTAIVLKNISKNNVSKIVNVFNIDEIKNTEDFKLAVFLSQELFLQIIEQETYDSRLIVTIYNNPSFFNEESEYSKESSSIIGVSLPRIQEAFAGNLYTIYNANEINTDFNCAYWKYNSDDDNGYWKYNTQRNDSDETVTCAYDHLTHLALVQKIEVNITQELEEIVASDHPVTEKLKLASTLTKSHYMEFQPIHILLISELLSQVDESNITNLELVSDIVDIVINLNSTILEKSQELYNATGKILSYFDQILAKAESDVIIKRGNFYVAIQSLNEKKLYGFTIDGDFYNYNFNILYEQKSIAEILETDNLDTALLLTEDLLDQLISFRKQGYIPKIVITIFFSDDIFMDDYSKKKIPTKIVGVFFPDFEGILNGSINIFYAIDLDIISNYTCSVYYYDNDCITAETGYWNTENPPYRIDHFLQCEFWKETHYALVYSLTNFTSKLEYLLQSTDSIEEILDKTNLIVTNYYKHLLPVDISVMAQILARIIDVDEHILLTSSSIVNSIMKIPRQDLDTLQELYNAMNNVLYIFDKIVGRYNKSLEIYEDNFIIIISLLSEKGFYELTLQNCAVRCSPSIFYNVSDANNRESKDADYKLKINSDLVDQLLMAENEIYISKLVLIVYYMNDLFNEETKTQNIGLIFRVQFPDFIGIISEEIKIIYRSTNPLQNYICSTWAYQLDECDNVQNGSWHSVNRASNNDDITCSFYQQGYFTFVEGTLSYDNITGTLESILKTNGSFSEKLYLLEDISYDYHSFSAVDVYVLSEILAQCNELRTEGVNSVTVIINNVLDISRDILINSQVRFNATRQILHNINNIANYDTIHLHANLNKQFAIVVCPILPDDNHGAILSEKGISCSESIGENDLIDGDNIIAGLVVNKKLYNVVSLSSNGTPKIIVSVFLNDVFFNIDEKQNTSVIIGFSVPNFEENLSGNISVLFNSNIYNMSNYNCAYFDLENNVLWKVKDEINTELFTVCTIWKASYLTLIENEDDGDCLSITSMLKLIIEGDYSTSTKLYQTLNVVALYKSDFEAYHVYLVSKILESVQDVDTLLLEIIVNIVGNIMDISRAVLAESQEVHNATDWILYHVDRIAEIYDRTATMVIDNFALIISNNITGLIIENCTVTCTENCVENCKINILYDKIDITALKENKRMSTALIIEEGLLSQLKDDPTHNLIITIYFRDVLFNEDNRISYRNLGKIIGLVVPYLEKEYSSLFKFYYNTQINTTEICAFWNYSVQQDAIMKGHWEEEKILAKPSEVSFCETNIATHFTLLAAEKNVTDDLENIINSNATIEEKLQMIIDITNDYATKLTPIDIYLISQLFEIAIKEINTEELLLITYITSSLFNVPRDVLRKSQLTYSATDKILYSIDEMAKIIDEINAKPIVQENFVLAIYDLKETKIAGLILENCSNTKCNITILKSIDNFTQIADNENLETAIVFSEDLIEYIVQTDDIDPKLVVTVFFSDALFNEPSTQDTKTSKICGILLPGLNFSMGSIHLLYKTVEGYYENNSCAFWNFKINDTENLIPGSWKMDSDPRNKERFTICEFNHTTHFALLLANDDNIFNTLTYTALGIITDVNCLLSLIGVFGILLTAALFERWRRNTGNQILVNFALAISIKIVMLYVSVGVYQSHGDEAICYIMGAILHYAILSEFCWMLIIAILQFKRFVEVLGGPPKYILLKACICGWVFPLLPVTLILIIDTDNYSEGHAGLCYPSGLGLYLGIWLPIIIIITINLVIFIFIVFNVFHKKTETRDLVNHEILFQWRLALLLFSMLGLTWLFGFLGLINGVYIFTYLFCFTATMQGFVMFLFFIVFNQSTRFLYSQSIKLWLYTKGYKMQ